MGLIGGTSWASTLEYYKIINQKIEEKLKGLHSAHCILYSVDFEECVMKHKDNWDLINKKYVSIAKKLEKTGAEFIIICANTMHKTADSIEKNIKIPLVHIADAAAEEIIQKKLKKVGLLGTKNTMQEDFYRKRLENRFDIKVITPDLKQQDLVHNIILDELVHGTIKKSSKTKYLEIINDLISKGSKGIILGCTEIPLLIKQNDVEKPVFDTTRIHAEAAVKYALK